MGNVKPWQIVLMVAAVVAVGVSAYLTIFNSDRVVLADRVRMVDVNTGEEFDIAPDDIRIIPSHNPKADTFSLLPVQEQDGKLFVIDRYRGAIQNIEGTKAAVVDARTGEVRVAGTK